MKIKKGIDINAFMDTIKKCQGSVYYKTVEGDQLNLKSLLSQYILISIIDNPDLAANGIIDCSQEQDYGLLKEFLQ
ncbi:MAG: polya polymerase [Lachnospiraceae bacterium]|nr:polya polymerase [Lachnospiraceae bacterium]